MSSDLYSELMACRRRLEDNQRGYQEASQSVARTAAARRRDEVCLKEFSSMPPTTPFFRGVGKAYIMQPQSQVAAKLDSRIRENTKLMEQARGKQHYYEAQCKSNQKKMDDLFRIANSEAIKK